MINQLIQGDALTILKTLPDKYINCCVTSPPYWNLRDYEILPSEWAEVTYSPMAGLPRIRVPKWTGCLGLEPTPEMFVGHIVEIFREVRRVLRDDGTLWLNFGDCYTPSAPGTMGDNIHIDGTKEATKRARKIMRPQIPEGLKPKNLVGIPWRVAFALQADGWYLRSDIIWHKPNPMPESVTDRPTKSHEYLFLLSKSRKYCYDLEAIKEPAVYSGNNNGVGFGHGTDKTERNRVRCCSFKRRVNESPPPGQPNNHRDNREDISYCDTRNKRTVWTVPTHSFSEAHFATFPPKLIEPCILAGCPNGGIVLDPFMGAGTAALVAIELGRNYLGIELSEKYIKLEEKRISEVQIRMPLSSG
jgi:DNA modification methylase